MKISVTIEIVDRDSDACPFMSKVSGRGVLGARMHSSDHLYHVLTALLHHQVSAVEKAFGCSLEEAIAAARAREKFNEEAAKALAGLTADPVREAELCDGNPEMLEAKLRCLRFIKENTPPVVGSTD